MQQYDTPVLIIGSGPAGYMAGVYAARAGLKPVLYAGAEPGGQLMTTGEVENFPGRSAPVLGPAIMNDLYEQAQLYGCDIRIGMATEVDFSDAVLRARIDEDQWISAQSVIIATGATARLLGLPRERALMGKGVSTCATCDGYGFRGRPVAVVGGGDSAAEEALQLAAICPQVTLIVRGDRLRASNVLRRRLAERANIEIVQRTEVRQLVGNEALEGLVLRASDDGAVREIAVAGLFVAIGHDPNTALFKAQLSLDAHGYIEVNRGSTATSALGVFAAGDVADSRYRQAATAVGFGCMAALDAERYLRERG